MPLGTAKFDKSVASSTRRMLPGARSAEKFEGTL